MEFIIGAVAAVGAGFVTNPLEVVKVRLQLQGELKAKGHYKTHYRGFFHAFYIIGKTDGLLALQKGLVPASCFQVVANGIRLGLYQFAEERKWNLNKNGEFSMRNSLVIGAVCGAISAFVSSPLYLVKVHLQSKSAESIAVGTQHQYHSSLQAFGTIYRHQGVLGMWRGCSGGVVRAFLGSGVQLATFDLVKQTLQKYQILSKEKSILNTAVAGTMGGVAIGFLMVPFDVFATRLYNQGVDSRGKGLFYSSYVDCVYKVLTKEGFLALYKGVMPCTVRTGSHTVLCLVFWDELKLLHKRITGNASTSSSD